MHRNPIPHTWMHRNHHPSSKCTKIFLFTHERTKIVIPQVNAPETCPLHMNDPKSCLLRYMHRNPTPHTWMHWHHHFSCEYTDILPSTHECTEIIIPQVNATESYSSHTNVSISSPLRKMDRHPTSHTWMHRCHHPSSKCTGILPLTHQYTEIVTPQVNAPISHLSHMNTPKSLSLK